MEETPVKLSCSPSYNQTRDDALLRWTWLCKGPKQLGDRLKLCDVGSNLVYLRELRGLLEVGIEWIDEAIAKESAS